MAHGQKQRFEFNAERAEKWLAAWEWEIEGGISQRMAWTIYLAAIKLQDMLNPLLEDAFKILDAVDKGAQLPDDLLQAVKRLARAVIGEDGVGGLQRIGDKARQNARPADDQEERSQAQSMGGDVVDLEEARQRRAS